MDKGSFGKAVLGSFLDVHCLEIPEKFENLEILESHQSVENRGEWDHFLEILENLDFGDSGDSSSEKTPFVVTPFSGPECLPLRPKTLQVGHRTFIFRGFVSTKPDRKVLFRELIYE